MATHVAFEALAPIAWTEVSLVLYIAHDAALSKLLSGGILLTEHLRGSDVRGVRKWVTRSEDRRAVNHTLVVQALPLEHGGL